MILLLIVFWNTKHSNYALVGIMFGLYGLKIILKFFWENEKNRKYLLPLIILGIIVGFMIYMPLIPDLKSDAFNTNYIGKNFRFYFEILKSGYNRYLWYYQKLITTDWVFLGFFGLVISFVKNGEYLVCQCYF